MKRKSRIAFILILTIWSIISVAPAAIGQTDQFQIDYTVRLASIEGKIFHITADVNNIDQDRLELSLPTWTPGW